jgi:hypothetical protein
MTVKSRFLFLLILSIFMAFSSFRPASAQDMDHLHVLIDIKPGSYPNPINLGSKGLVPVALFGSSTFAVSLVDPASVRFGRMLEMDSGAAPVNISNKDVNNDGFMDFIFQFRISETGLLPTDTEACLHGLLLDGTLFCGHDSIVIVP